MLVDYHIHAAAHGENRYSLEWMNLFLEKARQEGIKELGFSEHDEFINLMDYQVFEQIKMEWSRKITVRLGIEVDYIPGREPEIKSLIQQNPYDYVIGSVHFIDGWGFDHPDYREGFNQRDIDDIYGSYAKILLQMSQTRSFDIVGHIDLVKIWGHRPQKHSSLYYLEPVLKSIKYYDLAVEINSAGLRKEVKEIYPAADIADRLYQYDIPITFGSDAHNPDQTGEGLTDAYQCARRAGYRYLVRFEKRQKIYTPMNG